MLCLMLVRVLDFNHVTRNYFLLLLEEFLLSDFFFLISYLDANFTHCKIDRKTISDSFFTS